MVLIPINNFLLSHDNAAFFQILHEDTVYLTKEVCTVVSLMLFVYSMLPCYQLLSLSLILDCTCKLSSNNNADGVQRGSWKS